MLSDALEIPYPTTFFDLTLIGNEFYPIKTGKEATVYVCEAGPAIDAGVVAAKVYHTGNVRSFQNDAAYREGRFVGDSRLRRAMAKKTRTGRKASLADWVSPGVRSPRTAAPARCGCPGASGVRWRRSNDGGISGGRV